MNRLKELRNRSNISQAQFAKDIGVAQNTVSNWENGNRLIDNETLNKIADYFKVSTDYLLGRDVVDVVPKDVTDEDIKFALFGGEVNDEAWDDVKGFVDFIRQKYKLTGGKKDEGNDSDAN